MGFNYRGKRIKFKTVVVDRLPRGSNWLPVSRAALFYRVSSQTVRCWYLGKKIKAVKYKGIFYVEINDRDGQK